MQLYCTVHTYVVVVSYYFATIPCTHLPYTLFYISLLAHNISEFSLSTFPLHHSSLAIFMNLPYLSPSYLPSASSSLPYTLPSTRPTHFLPPPPPLILLLRTPLSPSHPPSPALHTPNPQAPDLNSPGSNTY